MKKQESEFIRELESLAKEQRKLAVTQIMPDWAVGIGEWLVVNPWRVLVPIAGILYLSLRVSGGVQFRELILGLFGGFS